MSIDIMARRGRGSQPTTMYFERYREVLKDMSAQLPRVPNMGTLIFPPCKGWNSPAMPLRYAEDSQIANEGVKLANS
jgi:hypothetical protein